MPDYTAKLFNNVFSKYDSDMTLSIISDSLSCSTQEDFKKLARMSQKIIPFDYMTSCIGLIDTNGISDDFGVLNISYPEEWLSVYLEKGFSKLDPLVILNFSQFKLQIWKKTYKICAPPKKLIDAASDFGLKNGYTHGVRNHKATEGSLFSFAGDYLEYSEREQLALEMIIPHLHFALNRVLKIAPAKQYNKLTSREIEVLKWAACGKTSWDTSLILGIGLETVKQHMKNIRQKLDVVSKSQAVAVAFEQNLMDIP
jgi:DNA-binding CsgD family transcriptional regulator